jgi:hypothetical protein
MVFFILIISSYKVGPDTGFWLRERLAGEVPDHPRHVTAEGTHGLHALLVLRCLTGRLSIDHVPVLAADQRHVQYSEILVQAVEGCRGTTTTTDDDTGTWLILQMGA